MKIMYDYSDQVRKWLNLGSIQVDNSIFRLHKYTIILLMFMSIIVSFKTYFENPMSCMSNNKPVDEVVNSYCWMSTTYTLYKRHSEEQTFAKPLLEPKEEKKSKEEHVQYYQYVCFILILQALFFYFPVYTWRIWEGGRIGNLTDDMKEAFSDLPDHRRKVLCHNFFSNTNNHNIYFVKYLICELFNLGNVIGQLFLIDIVFNGYFITHGVKIFDLIRLNDEDRSDSLSTIFPKVTKCSMNSFADAGSANKMNVVCILPVNNANEKIYVFLWYWFVALSFVTALSILYRLVTIFSVHLRYALMTIKFRIIPKQDLWTLCDNFRIGDWFMFYQISKNVDTILLREFALELSDSLNVQRQFVV